MEFLSPYLAMRVASYLFSVPYKFRISPREIEEMEKRKKGFLHVPALNKSICIYNWQGNGKNILLVHGWSGRGTSMYKIAQILNESGFNVISFDAPAHGKSEGTTTGAPEFVQSINLVNNHFNGFYAIIGHSLATVPIFKCYNNLKGIEKIVTIGSVNKMIDIFENFTARLKLKKSTCDIMIKYLEKKFDVSVDSYAAEKMTEQIECKILMFHDKDDREIPIECSRILNKKLKNSKLIETTGLGHSRILKDIEVAEKIKTFILEQ
jgi:pimeloyl-ACP methyl ester carboxylesterase